MVKSSEDRVIPRQERLIESMYRRKLPGLKRRIQRKSVRRVAMELRVSHPTLLTIMKGVPVSRRIMVKIIQKTTGKKRKPFYRIVGHWVPDAI